MKFRELLGATCALAALAAFGLASSARAADFYEGKTITIVCPYSPGGTYDRMARLAARFLPGHIPGKPTAIVQNRPGGGGMIGIRAMVRADPDGLTIAHFTSPVVVRQLTGGVKDVDFRKLNWLGSPGGAHYVLLLRAERKEHSIAELKAANPPIRIGSSGPASLLTQAAKFLERAGKLGVRPVAGYKGFNPMALALKQKEIDAVATAGAALEANIVARDMFNAGTIRIAMTMGGAPPPAKLADTVAKAPKFLDAIESAADREAYVAFSGLLSASRPFATTPGVPAERVAILRKAMADMMADPAFRKAATGQGFVLNALNGEETEKLVLSPFKLPADIRDRLTALLN